MINANLQNLNKEINDLDRALTAKEIDFHSAMQRGDNLVLVSLDLQIKEMKVNLKRATEEMYSLES